MATSLPKLKLWHPGIRFRISTTYAAVVTLVLAIFSFYLAQEHLLIEEAEYDQFIRSYAIDVSRFIDPQVNPEEFEAKAIAELKYFPFNSDNTFIQIYSPQKRSLYSYKDAALPIPVKNFGLDEIAGVEYRFFKLALPDQRILVVATSLESVMNSQNRIIRFLLTYIPLSILIMALSSFVVVGQALKPIRMALTKMRELITTKSYQALPVPAAQDEISDLIKTFNVMLSQVKKTIDAQDQFVANASHQLNTPLAIIKGELDVLTSKPRTQEEIDLFHKSLNQELLRMKSLVRDMLLISRVESDQASFIFQEVHLDDILTETVARFSALSLSKGVSLKCVIDEQSLASLQGFEINGERQLLLCLFENLIENAIKYSTPQSTIQVDLKSSQGLVHFSISNSGPVMSEEVIKRIMDSQRFTRGELKIPGTGLGLYLVKKIAEYHKAEILITSSDQQTQISLKFNQKPIS